MNKWALFLGAGILAASCTSKSVPQQTDTDDMYVKSGDLVLPNAVATRNGESVSPLNYDDSYDRLTDGFEGGSEDYYDENFLSSKDYKRSGGNVAGYNDGYDDGYSQGWSDNSWTMGNVGRFWGSPYGFNNYYNSFNSGFGRGMFMSYAPYWGSRMGMNIGWGMNYGWAMNYGWGGSRWGGGMYDPFYNDFAYGWGGYPYYGYNSFYSPWGYNRFGYNPYSPWGYNDFYGYGGIRNPYYGNQSAYNAGRTVRQRNSSVANSRYNERIVNRSAANNARMASNSRTANTRSAVGRSASSARTSEVDRYSRGNSRPYDGARTSNRVQSSSSSRSGSYAPSSRSGSYTPSSSGRTSNTYSRPSSNSRSTPTYNRSSSGNSGSSRSYGEGRSSTPTYSAPARTSSPASTGGGGGGGGRATSSGGGSRGRG